MRESARERERPTHTESSIVLLDTVVVLYSLAFCDSSGSDRVISLIHTGLRCFSLLHESSTDSSGSKLIPHQVFRIRDGTTPNQPHHPGGCIFCLSLSLSISSGEGCWCACVSQCVCGRLGGVLEKNLQSVKCVSHPRLLQYPPAVSECHTPSRIFWVEAELHWHGDQVFLFFLGLK